MNSNQELENSDGPLSDLEEKSKSKSKNSFVNKPKKEKDLSSSNPNCDQIKEAGKKSKKKLAAATEPSTAQGTSETNSASKQKLDKSGDSS